MPQLDLLTFFTQFFWAILCLFTLYFFVNKLILPELTRVLKYRSKASALSTPGSGEKLDTTSQRDQKGISDTFSHSSKRSGSSTLYQYACNNSLRVLIEARQKRDTFLDGVTSSKAIKADSFSRGNELGIGSSSGKGFASKASPDSDSQVSSGLTAKERSSIKATRSSSSFAQTSKGDKKRKSFNSKNPKSSEGVRRLESSKNSKSSKNFKGSKES